jgi:hypothetical protein
VRGNGRAGRPPAGEEPASRRREKAAIPAALIFFLSFYSYSTNPDAFTAPDPGGFFVNGIRKLRSIFSPNY